MLPDCMHAGVVRGLTWCDSAWKKRQRGAALVVVVAAYWDTDFLRRFDEKNQLDQERGCRQIAVGCFFLWGWIEWETNKKVMKGMRLLQLVQQRKRRGKWSLDQPERPLPWRPWQDEPLVDFDRKRAQAGKIQRLYWLHCLHDCSYDGYF